MIRNSGSMIVIIIFMLLFIVCGFIDCSDMELFMKIVIRLLIISMVFRYILICISVSSSKGLVCLEKLVNKLLKLECLLVVIWWNSFISLVYSKVVIKG